MNPIKNILSNTWASVVLLCVIALCLTALVWHGDLTVAQLKAALATGLATTLATWYRGAASAVVEAKKE